MKITTVFAALNNNPKQIRFVPSFVHAWQRLYPEFRVRIVFVGSSLPSELEPFREFIQVFPEIPGVSTVYTAQTIRLLYPALLDPAEVTVITDIDMLPGNRTQFKDKIAHVPDNAFLSLRPLNAVWGGGQIAMCYNAASTEAWQRVFGIRNEDDVRRFLTEHAVVEGEHGGKGWFQDQILLQNQATRDPHFVALDDSGQRRLDWFHHQQNQETFQSLLQSEQFSDAHIWSQKCPWNFEDMK